MPEERRPIEPQVEALKHLLERELDVRARPFQGCWPLVVAVLGLLVAAVLLLTRT